jgi:NitT/TauT family transport system substrate-binding protein
MRELPMRMRQMLRQSLLPVFMAVLAPQAIAQRPAPAPELPRVTLAVGGQAVMIYLPLTIADRLGYFRDAGLDVEIDDFSGGSKALQAVIGGSADVVAGVYEHTIRVQAAGQHLRAFVVMARSMQLALAVAAGEAAHVRSAADLKGLRIGVSAAGSTTEMMLDRVLAGAHLTAQQVSEIGVGLSASAVAAVSSGAIDAICTAEPTASLMEHRGLIKVLVDARTEAGTAQVFGGPIPTSVLYARDSFVIQNPRTVQALTNAIIRAGQWLSHVSPAELARVLPASFLAGDQAVYLEAFAQVRDGYSTDGRFPEGGAQNTLDALAAFDTAIHPSGIRLSETFTNQFALNFSPPAR